MYNNTVIPLILFLLSDVFFGQAPSFGQGLNFLKKGQAWEMAVREEEYRKVEREGMQGD